MNDHNVAVKRISEIVKDFHSRREPFRIFHGSTSSTRPAHGQRVVDISELRHVLHIDTAAAVAIVEPNVAMDQLVAATYRAGMVPPVVMEFPGITVGGGFAGSAGESSSFRYGYFDETVLAVEIILATGEVVNASKTENADLFKGLGGGSRMTFQYLVHDLSLPYSTVQNFIDYVADNMEIWPLWLCPLRAIEAPSFHPYTTEPGGEAPQPMLNVGVWGHSSKKIDRFMRQNRDLEAKLMELGGRKVLYSHAYYTEKEFWDMYDKDWYTKLRERYSATSLPDVYDKVVVDVTKEKERKSIRDKVAVTWPFAGLIGVWSAIRK
ncbi:Delta(24)-sterol reductase [Colletotrichum sp. SAR 10_98]|nr:Delta(24)-sterol reductase [Colletotrichum sp. SAR 10_98]